MGNIAPAPTEGMKMKRVEEMGNVVGIRTEAEGDAEIGGESESIG